jgi:molybdate/tungstate transport system substrate-binding protein
MKQILLIPIIPVFLMTGCTAPHSGKPKELIIFHAGSLSVPFKEMKDRYEQSNKGVRILLEPAGSLVCARKITELRKPCDIIASADYFVIRELLIPEYAGWNIRFATNSMVIAYNDKSRYSSEINSANWTDILLRKDVIYSRSDPDSDPGGYRAVLAIMLAEKYYIKPGLTEKLLSKNREFIRPKEVDLIALIESGSVDYMFQYKSVAIQHGLKYIELPDEINLSDPSKDGLYGTVSVEVTGNTPGSRIKITGGYINYSLAIPDAAPNKELAIDFVSYMLSEEGSGIFRHNGQEPLVPVIPENQDKIPAALLKYLPDYKQK